jgi:ABC-type uncharacterized transport system permease subunit
MVMKAIMSPPPLPTPWVGWGKCNVSIMQYRLTNCAISTIFFQLCEKYSLVFWVASRRRKKTHMQGTITLKWDIVPLPMNAIFNPHDSLGKSAGNILCVYIHLLTIICALCTHIFSKINLWCIFSVIIKFFHNINIIFFFFKFVI